MALTKFKVTNITNGRLELRPYKIVLGPNESTELVAPVAEEVHWLLGRRFVTIQPLTSTKVQPFSLSETQRPSGVKGRRDRNEV